MNKKIILEWFLRNKKIISEWFTRNINKNALLKRLTRKRLYIIISSTIALVFFLILISVLVIINNKHYNQWINVFGTVSINTTADKKSSIVSLKIKDINNDFNKIRGNISLSLENDSDNINLNGIFGRGELLPYSNKIIDQNSKKSISYNIERVKESSKLIIIFNFNISGIQKFTYHLSVGNFTNAKSTTPFRNIKKTIPETSIKNITKINNTITDNPIYTKKGKGGFMGDMNSQLGYYPGIVNSNYSFDTKSGTHNYNTWNNFNTHIWRGTTFAYHQKITDCNFIINLSKNPLIFNYDSENNKKSQNILNGFTSSFNITGKDSYSNLKLKVQEKNVPMRFYWPLITWLGQNYKFQLGTNKTVSISFLKIDVTVRSVARVDSIQGKVQMFVVPKIVKIVGQIS